MVDLLQQCRVCLEASCSCYDCQKLIASRERHQTLVLPLFRRLTAREMKLTVKTVSKEEHAVEITGAAPTVRDLKKAACDKMAIGDDSALTLIHLGTVLKDDAKTLVDVGIADGAVVIAMIKKQKTAASPAAAAAAAPAVPVPALAPTPSAAVPKASAQAICLTVSDVDGDVRMIEVDENETVENVKALLEVEFAVPLAQQVLFFETKQLQDGQRLNEVGIKTNDMLMMQALRSAARPVAATAQRPGAGAGPVVGGLDLAGALANVMGGMTSARSNPLQAHMNEANQLLQMVASDPHMTRRINENNKPLADALATGNPEKVAQQLLELAKEKREIEFKKQQAIMRLNADPFDAAAQKEIEEMVRMENVNSNLESAMEYNPEAFARVVMLYVDCEVNGTPIKAFVDSGAQSTIMSQPTAERLGIMRLIDYRYAGVAKGVGTSKIIGRIHAVPMKIGGLFLTISITVLEDKSMEFLFGLDNLRRHQMCIDLKDNMLKCENMAVPFLGEADLPKSAFGTDDNKEDAMDVEAGAGAAAAGGSGVSVGGGGGDDVSPAAIEALTSMGFTREQAVTALRSCGGNPELAASLIFEQQS